MPYTIDGAVIDGVFLMISPLSIGSHVIHVTFYFSFSPVPVSGDFTYYLIVQPAPLSIALNKDQQIALSWPHTLDSYTLESSPSLDSPNWQPVTNLSVSVSDGIYHATGPVGSANQFFRLRPN